MCLRNFQKNATITESVSLKTTGPADLAKKRPRLLARNLGPPICRHNTDCPIIRKYPRTTSLKNVGQPKGMASSTADPGHDGGRLRALFCPLLVLRSRIY